ncbi:hypothetical protein [Salinicola sp. MIT1003]|uniref:hypothetical protein n=1 Tax=Salinicola sp. MIT1003 TaxID=1882734 RepID=UPI001114F12A|nr:hypothetical protein [Salinicola sp. MIT1003]
MLKAVGIFLIIFGGLGLVQNLRFLLALRKISKTAPDETPVKTAVNEHFLGLLAFSVGMFSLGIYLVQR